MAEGQTKSDYGNILEVHCVELDADTRCFPTDAEMSDFLANWRKTGQFAPLPGSPLRVRLESPGKRIVP